MTLQNPEIRSEPGFIFKVLFVALVLVLLGGIYTIAPVFILGFGAAIVAAALNNMAAPVAYRLRIPRRLALVMTTVALIVFSVTFLAAFGAQAADQYAELAAKMPEAWTAARAWLDDWSIGRWLLSLIDTAPAGAASGIVSALPLAGGVLGWLANAAFILVIGIYMAADADTYIDGAIMLLPPSKRLRARAIIHAAGDDLRKWLVAMTLDMLFLGAITGVGLWLIGAPFPFSLGTITGVAVFVPYIGPLLSIVPGVLLALSVSPQLALYAIIVYTVALQLEGNISLPLLQRWTVQIPPAVTLLAIVGFGLIFGIWGVLLATPLAVVTMTIVRMAYVEDFLTAK